MITQALCIKKVLLDKMVSHAESVSGECCGFLFGSGIETRKINTVLPAKNIAENTATQFKIDPLEYLTAEHFAEANATNLIGIYHSHPNHPAIPSESDRLAAQPNLSYVILSIKGRKFDSVRSWRLNSENNFIEEPIQNQ